MTTEFHIIYPSGDKTKLKVLSYDTHRYDLGDYAIASRKTFYDHEDATAYAKYLAKLHGLSFDGEPDYLD